MSSFQAAIRHLVLRAWAESACGDLVALDGRRAEMLEAIAGQGRRVVDSLEGDGPGYALAAHLLNAAARIDDGNVWHRGRKLRSYVDVSIQVRVLGALVALLEAGRGESILGHVLECFPDSRPALLVQAERLLAGGALDEAIAVLQRALRIQAVCFQAQEMLQQVLERRQAAAPFDLRDRFCPVPFTTLSTGYKGSAFACSCPAWVPYPIGNVLEAANAEELWNSDAAQEIRRSVLDGDYRYCSRTLCSWISSNKLPLRSEITEPELRSVIDEHTTRVPFAPKLVDLNYDSTCNLACPSCRTEIISAQPEEQAAFSRARDRVILPLLRKVTGRTYISGGGDAIASKHYRSVLRALNRAEYPDLSVFLLTNALLLTPQRWSTFPHLGEMIRVLSVSVDAACAETYEKLRRPGKWATLLPNLEFIAELRRAGKIAAFWINFVVQKDNYREILDFVALGERLGVDKVWFQRVVNYGAYDEATFQDVDVTSPDHPEHGKLLEILRSPVLKRERTQMVMLMSLVPEVFTDFRMEDRVTEP